MYESVVNLSMIVIGKKFDSYNTSSWYSDGIECGSSRVQSPVKDRVIPNTL